MIISCFSGIGGLEGTAPASLFCEFDPKAQLILEKRYPTAKIHDDVRTLRPPKADVVLGGWPCQDISVAGNQVGLIGERSGLFYELLRIAKESKCQTLIAENVVNLLHLAKGDEFASVLREIREAGFEYISWRVLNVRDFGIPHQRRRLFIVASKDKNAAASLHRHIPERGLTDPTPEVAGFYWTAGLQSICYSEGFSPTLKVGSSLSIPSPPAVHFEKSHEVRSLTSGECLRLQGFNPVDFLEVSRADRYRMAGNAVATPVGRFVVDGVVNGLGDVSELDFFEQTSLDFSTNLKPPPKSKSATGSGWWKSAVLFGSSPAFVNNCDSTGLALAQNLLSFLDASDEEVKPLSTRAARGLLSRLDSSGNKCPAGLYTDLRNLAA